MQVEFVAVLAPGENLEKEGERVLGTTEDCDLELLLRMRNADRVRLQCAPVR